MTMLSGRNGLGLIAVVAIAAGGWFFLTERPVFVPVVAAEEGAEVRVYGLGTIEARVVSKIGFEVGAALTDLLADSNDAVTKGQILARLHPAEQEARVARAEAGLAAAKASILKADASVSEARTSIGRYLAFYNGRRPHSSLGGKTPDQAYFNRLLPISVAA